MKKINKHNIDRQKLKDIWLMNNELRLQTGVDILKEAIYRFSNECSYEVIDGNESEFKDLFTLSQFINNDSELRRLLKNYKNAIIFLKHRDSLLNQKEISIIGAFDNSVESIRLDKKLKEIVEILRGYYLISIDVDAVDFQDGKIFTWFSLTFRMHPLEKTIEYLEEFNRYDELTFKDDLMDSMVNFIMSYKIEEDIDDKS